MGESVRALLGTGAVGMNLEDGIAHTHLRPLSEAAARIAAARKAADAMGIPAFINARVDGWIVGGASPGALFDEAVRRARAYLDAGADGVYPIALSDPASVQAFCAAVDAPVNIGARVGLPEMAALGQLGVARVSTATRLAMLALSAARDAAQTLRETGRFDGLDVGFSYDALQDLFPNNSVSYTHLDVYKRQPAGVCRVNAQRRVRIACRRGCAGPAGHGHHVR